MIKKVVLLFNTVRFLKLKQLKFQVIYRFQRPRKFSKYLTNDDIYTVTFLNFSRIPPVYKAYDVNSNRFIFLNQSLCIGDEIDWNYLGYGRLWNYNLQYLNFIYQSDISVDLKNKFINSIYNALNKDELKLEPYPSSLRSINVLRFLNSDLNYKANRHNLNSLYAEFNFISKRLEFHLLGNHLLENLFSLLMGGAFFSNSEWVKISENLLEYELKEQILSDGAHFELSPMYHQIILFRLLELIDWYGSWQLGNKRFFDFIRQKAELMLLWLRNISYSDGDIPHFNDSTNGIAYSTNWLLEYGRDLGFDLNCEGALQLSTSGYRSYKFDNFECKIDAGPIGASYQPGHAHADALNFELRINGMPVVVDIGTSTYEIGERRNIERSTKGHNSVTINDLSQSQIWDAFRVGRRANSKIILESEFSLMAINDGFKKRFGIMHQRKFDFGNSFITISDELLGGNSGNNSTIARFYLHPECIDIFKDNTLNLISFVGATDVAFKPYLLADGFNKFRDSYFFEIEFQKKLQTTFNILNFK